MDEFTLSELLREVQCHLQHAVDEALLGANWCAPLPWRFGSQRYLLAGPTSEVDLLVLAPKALVEKGDDIRAIMARRLCDRGVQRHCVTDMPKLHTLKWSDAHRGVEVSVLFTHVARGPIIVTCFLRDFFEAQKQFRRVVFSVLSKLRKAGALNSHGLGASVGQSLKTASDTLWIVGL